MSTTTLKSRTQSERSAKTKDSLVRSAIECLVDGGYAYTTAVEVCRRAGVTRGAYHHHYPGMNELLLDVVEFLYKDLAADSFAMADDDSLEGLIRSGWARVQQTDFKAVIELWLASRNDPELGEVLAPAIAKLSGLFAPTANPRVANIIADDPSLASLYRLAFEALIGLALGRATSPIGTHVDHEPEVIDLLMQLARERKPTTS